MPECSPVLVAKVLKPPNILHDNYLNSRSGIRYVVKNTSEIIFNQSQKYENVRTSLSVSIDTSSRLV